MNSRASAAAALVKVVGEGQSLTAALESVLPAISRDNDRAFVQALCFGVLRWYPRLDFLLSRLAPKPIRDAEIKMLALLGLYQLEYTRVKPHAAVAETVAAAARKQWAKPLLNAVLRRYQREREQLQTLADADVSAATAHPGWLIGRIRGDWPDRADGILAAANLQAPLTLRVNRLRCERGAYLALLAEAGIPARAADLSEDGVVLDQAVTVERLPGFADGWVSVQDEAAQLAAGLMDLRPGQRVLDVCAAPGGKTLHLLETCPDLAEVVALDIAPDRLTRIRQNLDREGLTATLLAGDGARPSDWWDGRPFDRILLDAPCSATGVIRRHPDIKLLRQPGDIDALAATQRSILEAIWPLLNPGGLLVYATCSILKQENVAQLSRFLADHADAREIAVDAAWGAPCERGRQILPGDNGMDGFFYGRLRKLPA